MNKIFLSFIIIVLSLSFFPAHAHQPRLVGDQKSIAVESPEISKAYYGYLKGAPAKYVISSDSPFPLYVNILVPAIKGVTLDFSARVSRDGKLLALLDGTKYEWKKFYEEFGGDDYFMGPEYSKDVPAGNYEIVVYNPGNSGKYVLAIGEKESFTPAETLKTLLLLPRLKLYFHKSPLTAYFNKIGLFMAPLILILLAMILALIIWVRREGRLGTS